MFNKMSYYISCVSTGICIAMYVWIQTLNGKVEKLEEANVYLVEKVDIQNDSLNQLVEVQKIKDDEIKKSEYEAHRLRVEYDKAARNELNQKIPKDCEKAVEWAAKQGKLIYIHWTE